MVSQKLGIERMCSINWKLFGVVVLAFLTLLPSCLIIKNEMGWMPLADGSGKVWTYKSDSTYDLHWSGGMYDCVIHGSGKLSKYDNGKLVESEDITAFYGSTKTKEKHKISEGEYYVGNIDEDMFQGFGVYVKSKDVYVGQFKNSKPNGELRLYKNGKLYYDGNWRSGLFDGEGTLYKEDGSVKSGIWQGGNLISANVERQVEQGLYEGDVLNGKPHGHGKMTYNDGSTYEGEWKDGKWDGEGVFISAVDTLSGQFDDGMFSDYAVILRKNMAYEGTLFKNQPDGFGTAVFPGNAYYSGYWSDGKMSGDGELKYSNGDVYQGEWNDGEFNGWGKYTYASNGDVYEGYWKGGCQDGEGNYKSSKFEYKGEWQEGWINGKGTMIYPNGEYYDGDFVENERYGNGTYHFKSGNTYEGEWVDGRFNGLGTFYFVDGNYYEGEFHDGKIKGDGTLHLKIKGQEVAVTANWDGTDKIPTLASVMLPNGDVYEGELKNGMPTGNGHWISAEEIAVDAAIHKANDFYKKHKDTFEKIVTITSITLTAIEVASAFLFPPLAVCAAIANKVILTIDMAARTTSATVDAFDAYNEGGKLSGVLLDWGAGVATDAAFLFLPKALKSSPARKLGAKLSGSAKNVAKKSAVTIQKNQKFKSFISVVEDAKTGIRSSTKVPAKLGQGFKIAKKFTSAYLSRRIVKSKLYADYLAILKKGAIKLTDNELRQLRSNPGYLRAFIKAKTGDHKNFQEFFIRLSQGDKRQVKELLEISEIKKFVNSSIRQGGGKHEWLMTSKFEEFLTDPKWGKDGPFLALAQTKLVQKTSRVRFKKGGGHVSEIFPNTSGGVSWHNDLAKEIDKCTTKEELFVEIKKFAKKTLIKEDYQEFKKIFSELFEQQL